MDESLKIAFPSSLGANSFLWRCVRLPSSLCRIIFEDLPWNIMVWWYIYLKNNSHSPILELHTCWVIKIEENWLETRIITRLICLRDANAFSRAQKAEGGVSEKQQSAAKQTKRRFIACCQAPTRRPIEGYDAASVSSSTGGTMESHAMTRQQTCRFHLAECLLNEYFQISFLIPSRLNPKSVNLDMIPQQ